MADKQVCYKFYKLLDPIDSPVRYIGLTRASLSTRLAQHIDRVRRGNETNSHKRAWIAGLLEQELEPGIELIHELCYDKISSAYRHEKFLIYDYLEQGYDLVNVEAFDFRKQFVKIRRSF